MNNFYRLTNDKFPDIVFGVDSNGNELLEKINSSLSLIKPWNQCVPGCKNAKYTFCNLDVLCTFLFALCKFSREDIKKLNEQGWYVEHLDLSVYTSGLSKIWANYMDDEINSVKKTNICDYIDADYFIVPYKVKLPKNEVYQCFTKYYSNIKTYY